LADREVEGDWPALFDGPSRRSRVVFLGDRDVADVFAGVLELNAFIGGDVRSGRPVGSPSAGLFMVSFFVDVEATLERLAELGLGGAPRRVTQATPNGPIGIATVRDPDGVLSSSHLARSHTRAEGSAAHGWGCPSHESA
jgi:hypothetical protein